MNSEQVVDKLQYLLGTLRDGEKGFAEAAENATDPQLKALLSARANERTQMAHEISQHISRLGEHPREHGSVGAALHRTWLNVRDAITGRDDHAVIAESARGEGVAVENYEDVLKETELPAEIRAVVEPQYNKIKASQAEMERLKHQA